MPQAAINGLTLEYETFGKHTDPAMLMIMGLGSQLIQWPVTLCQQLAERGHFVIRYDNRDVGLSSRMEHLKLPNIKWTVVRYRLGLKPKLPYTLLDMAKDAVGLLDHLRIQQAHLVGVSMGGMIAQLIAIHFPERSLSLTSIMSTTGNPGLPAATPEATAALAAPLNAKGITDTEKIVEHSMTSWKAIMSPGFPLDDNTLRARCETVVRRGHYPPGTARHLLACICTADRRKQLQQLTLPTLVIHGREDPLMPLACGEDTARNIPGSQFHVIDGMGHDLPHAVLPQLVEWIAALAPQLH